MSRATEGAAVGAGGGGGRMLRQGVARWGLMVFGKTGLLHVYHNIVGITFSCFALLLVAYI